MIFLQSTVGQDPGLPVVSNIYTLVDSVLKSLPILLPLIFGFFLNWRKSEKVAASLADVTQKRAEELAVKTEEQAQRVVDTVQEVTEKQNVQLDSIHSLVNGNLIEVKAQLEVKKAEMIRLEAKVAAIQAKSLQAHRRANDPQGDSHL